MKATFSALPLILISLVLTVGIGIAGFLMLKSGMLSADSIWGIVASAFGDFIGGPSTPFSKAVECSYYRCVEGCNGEKVGGIEISSNVYCKETFCNSKMMQKLEITNSEGKVCGWDALQYPVELTEDQLKSSASATYSQKIGTTNFGCILSPDLNADWLSTYMEYRDNIIRGAIGGLCIKAIPVAIVSGGWLGWVTVGACGYELVIIWQTISGGNAYDNLLFLKPELIKSEGQNIPCENTGLNPKKITNAISKFKIANTNDKMYIFTEDLIGNRKFTRVDTTSPYYTELNSGEEYSITMFEQLNKWFRVQSSEGKDLFLRSSRYTVDNVNFFVKLDVICPDGKRDQPALFVVGSSSDMCVSNNLRCGDTVNIRCLDVDGSPFYFRVSFGGEANGLRLHQKINTKTDSYSVVFGGPYIILTKDAKNVAYHYFEGKVKSAYVPTKYQSVTLYEKENYDTTGRYITLSGSADGEIYGFHSSLDFNDKARSLELRGPTDCWVELYENENFLGKVQKFSPVGSYNDLGSFNGITSSVKIKEGCTATLYAEAGLKNHHITIAGDSTSLDFAGRTTSVKLNFRPCPDDGELVCESISQCSNQYLRYCQEDYQCADSSECCCKKLPSPESL